MVVEDGDILDALLEFLKGLTSAIRKVESLRMTSQKIGQRLHLFRALRNETPVEVHHAVETAKVTEGLRLGIVSNGLDFILCWTNAIGSYAMSQKCDRFTTEGAFIGVYR